MHSNLQYDSDGSGAIGPTELRNMYDKLGESFSKERLNTILSKVDVNNDGELDFREFVGMLLMFKLGNPRIGLTTLGSAAKNFALCIVSSPKSAVKEVVDDAVEGTGILMRRNSVYQVGLYIHVYIYIYICIMHHVYLIYIYR